MGKKESQQREKCALDRFENYLWAHMRRGTVKRTTCFAHDGRGYANFQIIVTGKSQRTRPRVFMKTVSVGDMLLADGQGNLDEFAEKMMATAVEV